MKEFRTRAIINAPAIVVWETLTNLDAHKRFDPNCLKIDGTIARNSTIKIISKLPGGNYKAKISTIRPIEIMVWESRLPFNLFKRVRTFFVVAKDDQTTEFEMVEIIDGYLLQIFSRMAPDLTKSFRQFSKGLKQFIESRP